MQIAGFDWDEANTDKCQKHGLNQQAIEAVFWGQVRVHPDPTHSSIEERFIAIGETEEGRPVFVGFTLRDSAGGLLIRPITARYMHEREARKYEETFAKNND